MKFAIIPFTCLIAVLALVGTPYSRAQEEKFNLDISSAKIVVSSNQLSSKEEELVEQLKSAMAEYFVVSKEDWTHKYSHVADGDSTGTLEWAGDDSKIWQWMIRPGGLATITDENGITTYLAKVVN